MHVLIPSNTQHTFKIVPREYLEPTELILKDAYTSEITNVNIDSFVLGNYLYITFTKTVIDEEKGQMEIKNGLNTIYRGMYQVTDQVIKDYNLTDKAYI